MRFGYVDLDEQLLSAHRGPPHLAVFAGAGASMDNPSSLPSFKSLASLVAKGTTHFPDNKEEPDRFLGRLYDNGIDVYQRAAEQLDDPQSEPNSLHHDLLRLFGHQDRVRVVTTNFDHHFETAAQNLFSSIPAVYRGPALPLGHDFSGIVALHGSVNEPDRMVLTDQDFGRAYLTEGWARRFLTTLFNQYVVLFVGYSHSEPIMDYLARALPPRTERFALVKRDDDLGLWHQRGIEPLPYPIDSHGGHACLPEAIQEWAKWSNQGALETERQIQERIATSSPSDEGAQDLLQWALKDPTAVRFFTRAATSPDWLEWAAEQGALQPLFKRAELSEVTQTIVRWVADFAPQYPDTVFLLIQRHGGQLHPHLAQAIARQIGRLSDPDGETLARWTAFLIQQGEDLAPFHFDQLLKRCLAQEAYSAAVSLLDYLTAPRLKSKRLPLPDGSEKVDFGLSYPHEHPRGSSRILELWEHRAKSRVGNLARLLWPTLVRNLQASYTLLHTANQADPDRDPISRRRSAIEPHEQDHGLTRPADPLINAARDVLDWALEQHPLLAQSWIDSLAASEAPLLRRIALHGIRHSNQLRPEAKLRWLLKKEGWLASLMFKHELLLLLRETYPSASGTAREALLERAEREIDAQADMCQEEFRAYKKYNLMYWLTQADPTCPKATHRLSRIQGTYPHFEPEYPDPDQTVGERTISW